MKCNLVLRIAARRSPDRRLPFVPIHLVRPVKMSQAGLNGDHLSPALHVVLFPLSLHREVDLVERASGLRTMFSPLFARTNAVWIPIRSLTMIWK